MSDLQTMLRDTARNGLQAQLDTAVTNGDTEAARKVAAEMTKLDMATAPKAPPYGNAEITAELNKQPWFGTDPKKSARVVELGKSLDPKKFASAEAFTAALVKAVEDDLKPPGKGDEETGEGETGEEGAAAGEGEEEPAPKPKPRRTDGPNDADTTAARTRRASSGPWSKMSDAPADVQKEINRTAEKFAGKGKENREKFITNALAAHYNRAQIAKGKK